jgi:hypothetical protein
VSERSYPPIAWLTSTALGFVVVGGIVMASFAPRHPPMGVASALLGFGLASLALAGYQMTRLGPFAWATFVKVFKWALLAYVAQSALIEFVFVRDHTRGAPLLVVTLMLLVFALSVPMTIAFTTARYAEID